MSRFLKEPTHQAFLCFVGGVLVFQEGPEWLRTAAVVGGVLYTARHVKGAVLGW